MLFFNHSWQSNRKCQIESSSVEEFPMLINLEFVFGSNVFFYIESLLFNPLILNNKGTLHENIKRKLDSFLSTDEMGSK